MPGRLIGWRSLDGADLVSAGSVTFVPSPDGRTTEVRVKLQYEPPAGPFGQALAALLGADPARQTAENLGRLKRLVEVQKRP